ARGQELTQVRVSMDGEHLRDRIDGSPSFVDPGMHVFRFEAEGYTIAEMRQMLRKGDRDRILDLALRPRPEEVPFRVVPESEQADAAARVAAVDARATDKREVRSPVELSLVTPLESRSSPAVGTYVAAGVGVVALSSFVYFGLSASNQASDLRRECKPNCPV